MLNKIKKVIDIVEEKGQNFIEEHPMITCGALWCSYLVAVGCMGKFYHDRGVETRKLRKAIEAANIIAANQK